MTLEEIKDKYGWDNYIHILDNYIYTNLDTLFIKENDGKIIEKEMYIPNSMILSIIEYNNVNYIDIDFIENMFNKNW